MYLSIVCTHKLVAFDVDGVMTDGSLTFTEDGKEIKTYDAKDGQKNAVLRVSRKVGQFPGFNIVIQHEFPGEDAVACGQDIHVALEGGHEGKEHREKGNHKED